MIVYAVCVSGEEKRLPSIEACARGGCWNNRGSTKVSVEKCWLIGIKFDSVWLEDKKTKRKVKWVAVWKIVFLQCWFGKDFLSSSSGWKMKLMVCVLVGWVGMFAISGCELSFKIKSSNRMEISVGKLCRSAKRVWGEGGMQSENRSGQCEWSGKVYPSGYLRLD